jgi:hypothetical protein
MSFFSLVEDDGVLSLLAPLTNPLAATVGAAAGEAASIATKPFAAFLNPSKADDADDDSAATPTLEADVLSKLQKLFKSVGVPEGERVTLHIDKKTGSITVGDDQPLAAEIEAALRNDTKLAGDIRRLAKVKDLFHSSPLIAETEVEAVVGEGGAVGLQWL